MANVCVDPGVFNRSFQLMIKTGIIDPKKGDPRVPESEKGQVCISDFPGLDPKGFERFVNAMSSQPDISTRLEDGRSIKESQLNILNEFCEKNGLSPSYVLGHAVFEKGYVVELTIPDIAKEIDLDGLEGLAKLRKLVAYGAIKSVQLQLLQELPELREIQLQRTDLLNSAEDWKAFLYIKGLKTVLINTELGGSQRFKVAFCRELNGKGIAVYNLKEQAVCIKF